MDIGLTDGTLVPTNLYSMSQRQMEILRNEIQRILDLSLIEAGQSDYATPMILVERPRKDPCPCMDYCKLNMQMQTEFSPPPPLPKYRRSGGKGKHGSAYYSNRLDKSISRNGQLLFQVHKELCNDSGPVENALKGKRKNKNKYEMRSVIGLLKI